MLVLTKDRDVCSLISLVITRFLLNLRQVAYRDQIPNSRISDYSSLRFPSTSNSANVSDLIIGNMGEPLEPGEDDLPDQEDDNPEEIGVVSLARHD